MTPNFKWENFNSFFAVYLERERVLKQTDNLNRTLQDPTN